MTKVAVILICLGQLVAKYIFIRTVNSVIQTSGLLSIKNKSYLALLTVLLSLVINTVVYLFGNSDTQTVFNVIVLITPGAHKGLTIS